MNTHPATPDASAIREALRTVQDPEIGMNIVDLGLVYDIAVEGNQVAVRMTMTSPACPMGQMILDDVDEAIARLCPELERSVELVWSPEWSPALMSESAKAHFGWQDDDA